jgi:putative FmdB family regulatory protein
MPFYEYVCTSCGAPTEILQRLSDPPETECPECHAQSLIKQVSAAGFRLKGGGWYETDFKAGAKRNLNGEGGAPAEAAGKGEAGAKAEGGEAKANVNAGASAHSCGAGCSHAAKAAPAASADKPAPSVPA